MPTQEQLKNRELAVQNINQGVAQNTGIDTPISSQDLTPTELPTIKLPEQPPQQNFDGVVDNSLQSILDQFNQPTKEEIIAAWDPITKLGQEVNEENVKKVVAATGAEIDDSKVKSLVASLKGVDIEKELENASLVTASAAAPVADDSSGEEKKKEEKPKEEKKEAAAEGLGALFG